MGAFHAYDIRGIYNVDFDRETAYKVGFFLPHLLETDKVLVGRDARLSSPQIRDALVEGITDAGASVTDIGLATTPMVYYATASYGFKASVQITASHNPKEYNGMKVSTSNALPVGKENGLGLIEEWIKSGKECRKEKQKGNVEFLDIRAGYIAFQMKYLKDCSSLKIGMDLSNGMAALVIKDIMKQAGGEISYIFDTIDGTFPGHDPNPLVAANIVKLQELVIQQKCDIGVIYDGDADRVMFTDETGRFISPDLMIALMGHYWLEEKGLRGKVLQDIRSSKAVGEYLEPMGAKMETWKVGRAFAARKLREIDGIYGGELAGHYYFRDFFYSDSGIMASLIILGIVSRLKADGIKLSQAIAKIEKYRNSGEINFRIEQKEQAMEAVCNYFKNEEQPAAFMDFDGYRIEFRRWWFNIRPSNTEPYLRFIAEATTTELLEQKVEKAREIISEFR